MKNLILILSVIFSFGALSEIVCEGKFKTKPYNFGGDGKVSITLPLGFSDLDGLNNSSIPMSIHIGDVEGWYSNFDGTGEIKLNSEFLYIFPHLLVIKTSTKPDFEEVTLGYVAFIDGFAELVLQKNLGGFTTNYKYELACR